MQSAAKDLLTRGTGLVVLLLVVFGIFALAIRKDESVSDSTGDAEARADHTATELFELGQEALNNRDSDAALARFSEAIRLDPTNAPAFYYRGGVLFARFESDAALADFSESIRLDPRGVRAFVARGAIHSQRKNYDLALADFSEAIRLDPTDAFSFNNRAFVHRQKREYEQAIADYSQAIRLNPQHDAPWGGLAWILATCPEASLRDGRKAVELATRACEIKEWKDRIALETLAAACAECGDFPSAVKWQQQAVAMSLRDPDVVEEGRRRLKLYEDEQPCREE